MRYSSYEEANRFAKESEELIHRTEDMIHAYESQNGHVFDSVRQYESLDDLEENLTEGQFKIMLSGYHFSSVFQHRPGKKLYVILSEAMGLREWISETQMKPRYSRWSYASVLDGSLLNIEDPMYWKYPGIIVSWFYGTKDFCLIDLVNDLVRAVCRHLSISTQDVIFYSGSAGGSAGIFAASRLQGSLGMGINPQLILSHFHCADDFCKRTGIDLREPDAFHRNDLIKVIKNSPSKFVILYNIASRVHDVQRQDTYFADEMGMELSYGLSKKGNVLLWGYYARNGIVEEHGVQEAKELVPYILSIGQKFEEGCLTEQDARDVLVFNHIWRWAFAKDQCIQSLNATLEAERQAAQEAAQAGIQRQEREKQVWKRCLQLALNGASFLTDTKFKDELSIGVPFLYACIQVLSICRPQQLLEFGFDEGTKIVAQYAEHEKCHHHVYDWDYERVTQLLASWQLRLHHTDIFGSDPVEVRRKGNSAIVYPAFQQEWQKHPDMQYDCILLKRSIVRGGAPSMDIMPYLPSLLSEDFVILVDCAGEACERMMIEDIGKVLEANGVAYQMIPLLDSAQDTCVIVSGGWAELVEAML